MALRSWTRVLLTALGVSAAAGAGQLGLAYGLGIVRFDRDFQGAAAYQWPAHLTWTAWFALVSVVLGALIGARIATTAAGGTGPGLAGRLAVVLASTMGALVVAPLTMLPARESQIPPPVDPSLTVALTAVLGAVAGLAVAIVVLSARPFAWNVLSTIVAGWVIALAAAAPSLWPGT